MNDRPVSKYLIAATVMLGTLMEVIDTSVANVALPHMQGTFSAGQDEVTWVLTSYLVANAVILPLSGWLGNWFGRKHAYLTALAAFTVASVGSGAAISMPMLVGMRVLQGLAGGAMVPMSQAILLETFPKEEHGKAMALFGVGVIFGPIVGPTLGGWITDSVGWRWVFYINAPLGLLGILLGYLFITDPPYLKKPEGRIDFSSFIYIALGLGFLEILLNRGQRYDWFHSPRIQIYALISLLGLALFVWRSFTTKRPLVDLRVFKSREFATGTLLMFLLGFGLYGSFTMLPLFAQKLLGYTATWAGLMLSPGGLMSLLSMAIVGPLVGRVDTRLLLVVGVVMNMLSMWLLRSVYLGVNFWYLTWGRMLQGFGMGFLFVPLTTAAFARLRQEQIGQAAGLFNLLRNEGGSIGIALSSTVLARHAQAYHAWLSTNFHPGNLLLQERLTELTRSTTGSTAPIHDLLAGGGGSAESWRILGMQVQQQAYVRGYDDVFFMVLFVFAIFLPFLLLLRGTTGKGGGMAH
ncbi:MAG TPA: DHA2 family efflux MFS transporter permease subunit [Candidatus Krumholzibacteria bacterium]|nr:DHA2 family efflux MFS transporter permease subunit [Candidatus Krumholzibacteria bacterium]